MTSVVVALTWCAASLVVTRTTARSSPPKSAWPNEPAGLPVINDQSWECMVCNGWNYHAEDGHADIQTDPTAPKSRPKVLRVVFPTTLPNDHQPAINYLTLGRARSELYGAYWMKLSPNWDTHGTKLNMIWAGNDIAYLHLSDGPTKKVGLIVLWSPYGYDNAPADRKSGGAWPSNVATTPISAGQWYLVELYMKYPATRGGGDGIMRWWVNGTMQGNYTKVRYPAGPGFIQYDYPFTRQVAPAHEQYVYIDHSHVSGR